MSDPLQLGPQKRRRINEWQVASNDMQGPLRILVHRPDEFSCLLSNSGPSSDSSDMDQSPPQLPPSNIWPTLNRQPKFQLFQNGEASPQQQIQQQNSPSNNSLHQPQPSPSNNSNNGMQATAPTSNQRFSMFPQQQQQTSRQQLFDHFFNQPPSSSSTQPPTLLSQQPVNNHALPCTHAQEAMSVGKQEPLTSGEIKSKIRDITDETTKWTERAHNVRVQKEKKEESSSPMSTSSESTDAIIGGHNGIQYPPTPSASSSPLPPSTSTITGSEQSKMKCLFQPDDLRTALMPTLDKLIHHYPQSGPFLQPVDPIVDRCSDYFDVIKEPMDLSTIRRKLEQGIYRDPWEYVDDVWLMFDNAWLYNTRKICNVYRYCTKLSQVFQVEIEPVMRRLGYCCGRKYKFNPQTLSCYGKPLCVIRRCAKYYSYQNQYTFCQNCFHEINGETVTIQDDDPTQPQASVEKSQFVELKNEHCELEPFVECQECGRKFHQICVLHIWSRGFTCDNCLKKNNWKRQVNRFTAKRLSTTKLGMYIETRVNNFLKKQTGAGHVYIRVVSSADKIVQVKPGMKSKFVDSGHFHETFPYKAKALFAFQKVDGVDVCFFGLHVQEYGSECPPPNSRRVYISYLDSVHFFQPRQYRTAVYHEILLGYLDYVKKLGYTIAHIWACPPSEGDDYIFYCHPQDQKIPKEKRLQEWYKKMLDRGIIERIVLNYKNILEKGSLAPPTELPYFEGDLWPTVIEDAIKQLDQEEKKSQDEAAAASTDEIEVDGHPRNKKRKGYTKAKKSKKLKTNHPKYNHKSNPPRNDLFAKLLTAMEKQRENVFVVRLHSVQSEAALKTIKDPDPCLSCDLMDGRDSFLSLARVNHYEFSSLRRAKFATLAMLYEIHNQGQEKFVYTCNNCENDVETRIHCMVCEDFDLCVGCFQNVGHQHKTILISCSDEEKEKEARKLGIERCHTVLVHAGQCVAENCRKDCRQMKRTIAHAQKCQKSDCSKCRHLKGICKYHARHCREANCAVCSMWKTIVDQQGKQQLEAQQRLEVTPIRHSLDDNMNIIPPRRRHQQPEGSNTPNKFEPLDCAVDHRTFSKILTSVKKAPMTPEQRRVYILKELQTNPQLSPVQNSWMSPTTTILN